MSLRRRRISYSDLPQFQFKTSATFSNLSGGGTSMVFPTSISPGDLVVMWDAALGPTLPSINAPPGFSLAVSDTFNPSPSPPSRSGIVFAYKYATSADAGRTFTGMAAGGESLTIIMVFEAFAGAFSSYASGDPSFDLGFGGVPPLQTISGSHPPAISFGLYVQGGGTFSPTFSPTEDGSVSVVGVSVRSRVSYKIFQTSAVDVDVTLGTAPNTNCLAGCFINGIV